MSSSDTVINKVESRSCGILPTTFNLVSQVKLNVLRKRRFLFVYAMSALEILSALAFTRKPSHARRLVLFVSKHLDLSCEKIIVRKIKN